MSFYPRIALASLTIALLTMALIWRGSQIRDVAVVDQAPNGSEVPPGSAISVTFTRPVDRRSAERSFVLTPVEPGRFFWEGQTMTFQPARPLRPETQYRVTIRRGMRDAQGRANVGETSWPFKTRGHLLLLLGSDSAGTPAVLLGSPQGGLARPLLTSPAGIAGVAVSPDGLRALVVERRDAQRTALVLLDLAGGASRALVDDPAASARGPAWSPQGDFVAFERRVIDAGAVGPPQVWLAQPDGASLGPLVSGDEQTSSAPVWSPDGNRLAFIDGRDQSVGVYSFFSAAVQAIPGSGGEPVSWFPDGKSLAVVGAADGGGARLLRYYLETGAAQDLGGETGLRSPAVSPDGAWIAFVRQDPGGPGGALWVMPADGGPARPLTEPGSSQDMRPAWSPDATRIAFVRDGGVYVVDLAGGEPRLILDGATHAVWVP